MMKKGLSKDGKEYQRPVAIIQLSPQEITLHEDVMYDCYTKESVKKFEQLYKKMHRKLTKIKLFSKSSKLRFSNDS